MVSTPEYSSGDKAYSDMGGDDYAVVEVKDVWSEEEEVEPGEGEYEEVYYYSFEFVNEYSPHVKGTVISKRRAEDFEEAWIHGEPE